MRGQTGVIVQYFKKQAPRLDGTFCLLLGFFKSLILALLLLRQGKRRVCNTVFVKGYRNCQLRPWFQLAGECKGRLVGVWSGNGDIVGIFGACQARPCGGLLHGHSLGQNNAARGRAYGKAPNPRGVPVEFAVGFVKAQMQRCVVFQIKAVLPLRERPFAPHEHPYVVIAGFSFNLFQRGTVNACRNNRKRNRTVVVLWPGIEQGNLPVYSFFNLIAFSMHHDCFANMHAAIFMYCDGR